MNKYLNLEILWNAIKVVAGESWDYEAVPFREVISRPRYQHLRDRLCKAAAILGNQQAKLIDALRNSTPSACQATAPQSPNYVDGKECGKCVYCRNTALLRELGEDA